MYFKTTAKFKTKVSVAFGKTSVFARNVFSSYVILEMSLSFTLFLFTENMEEMLLVIPSFLTLGRSNGLSVVGVMV